MYQKKFKIDPDLINIPTEIPPSFEIFYIPNMTTIVPEKLPSEQEKQTYIHSILDLVTGYFY